MEYNLISNVESCHIQIPQLLYYSHWPAIIISLIFGLFIFFKTKHSLTGKILLSIAISFSLWALSDLVVWITFDSRIYSFFWSFFEILSILFFLLVFYFGYVFIEEKDIKFRIKFICFVFFIPVILISATRYYFVGFDAVNCGPIMNKYFLSYINVLKGLISLGTILLLIYEYLKFKKDKIKIKKIMFIGFGLIFLLLSFLATQYVGDFISVDLYYVEFYGLFAITFFVGVLAYLIVKYKAFDIKMLGAQALMATLVILTGSQFFFIDLSNTMVVILVSVTVFLSVIFGIFLVNSVKSEVKRKEELQEMSNKLATANDRLTQLDNAKSEFISIASHQLRTPLTAVKGFVSLLLEESYGKVDEKQKEVLNKVYSSNDRLIHLVEDLLNVSRMESGRMQFTLAPTDMKAICKEVMDTFYIRAKEAGLYLEYKPTPDELPQVTIDGIKMKEVISNLVDNALKYCPKGGVTLRVDSALSSQFVVQNTPGKNRFSPETQGQNKKVVRVTVSDTGIGIPQTELPYLFAKFSRGKDISRLNTGGTGLGLYVGKAIVEANGSRVWAESDGEGKGSRFIVEIPVEQDPEIIKKWS